MHVFIRPTQRFLTCQVCQGLAFERREIKVTPGMNLFDADRAGKSADGAMCVRCGFLHAFLMEAHQWVPEDKIRPGDLPDDPHAGPGATGSTGSTGSDG